jgi:rubrerythrin
MKSPISLMLLMTALAGPVCGQGVPAQILEGVRSLYLAEANTAFQYAQYAAKAAAEQQADAARLFAAVSKGEAVHGRHHREALISLGGNPGEFVPDAVLARTTRENLEAAIERERFEMQAGEKDVSAGIPLPPDYNNNSAAEAGHVKLFREALANLQKGVEREYFVCNHCGFVDVAGGDCAGCRASLAVGAKTDRN